MSAAIDLRLGPATARSCSAERLLIIDVESLLLDPTPGIRSSLRFALQELGCNLPQHAFRHWSLRTPLREALAILMQCADSQRLDRATSLFFSHYEQDGRFVVSLRPGAVSLLQTLACDTRFELHYLTHIGLHAAARLLDLHGLGRYLRSIVTGERPQCPGVRLHLMRQLVAGSRRPPSSWVLLSDHPIEIMAAQEMHLRGIALGYGRTPLPTLLQLDPGAIAADLLDVGVQLSQLLTPQPLSAAPVVNQIH